MKFKIKDVTCDACIKLSNAALKGLPGVKKIQIEKDGLALMESDQEIAWQTVKEALTKIDKQASLI